MAPRRGCTANKSGKTKQGTVPLFNLLFFPPLVTLTDGIYTSNLEIRNFDSTRNTQCQKDCHTLTGS